MRGWAILNQAQLYTDKANLAAALDLFERALKFDPNNVDALVGAALSERDYYVFGGMDDQPEQITKIDHLLAHAIRIDPTNARAYTVRGLHYLSTRRTIEAEEAAQNAVRLNPNYAPAYVQLAQDQMMPAELPLAIANIDQAMKLSPRDPQWAAGIGARPGRSTIWAGMRTRCGKYKPRSTMASRLGPSTHIWPGHTLVWAGNRRPKPLFGGLAN